MGEGMARIVAMGVGALLAAMIAVFLGAGRRTNGLAIAIGAVVGLGLYLVLTWD